MIIKMNYCNQAYYPTARFWRSSSWSLS